VQQIFSCFVKQTTTKVQSTFTDKVSTKYAAYYLCQLLLTVAAVNKFN